MVQQTVTVGRVTDGTGGPTRRADDDVATWQGAGAVEAFLAGNFTPRVSRVLGSSWLGCDTVLQSLLVRFWFR